VIDQLGIPSPDARELIELDNKWGIIYEKIIGKSFIQVFSSQPLSLQKNHVRNSLDLIKERNFSVQRDAARVDSGIYAQFKPSRGFNDGQYY